MDIESQEGPHWRLSLQVTQGSSVFRAFIPGDAPESLRVVIDQLEHMVLRHDGELRSDRTWRVVEALSGLPADD